MNSSAELPAKAEGSMSASAARVRPNGAKRRIHRYMVGFLLRGILVNLVISNKDASHFVALCVRRPPSRGIQSLSVAPGRETRASRGIVTRKLALVGHADA